MAEKAQAEPTMEEILASIRKIISDEGGEETSETTSANTDTATSEVDSTVSIRTTDDDDYENLSLDDVIEKTGGSAEALGQDADDDLDPIAQTTPQEEEFPGDISDSMFEEDDTLHLSDDDRIGGEEEVSELDEFDLDVMSFEDETAEAAAEAEPMAFDDPTTFDTADAGWDNRLEQPEAAEPTTGMPEPEPEFEPDPQPAPVAAAEPAAFAPQEEPAMTTDTPETTSQASSGLTDDRIAGAAASALGKLMVKERRKTDDDGDPNTVEGLLRQMLRPMIKEWLDANLPDIVERKVEEEVQRIARMAR